MKNERTMCGRCRAQNRRGFTLVEVLVTAAIVGVGLMAVSSMIVAATKGNTTGERLSVGVQVATGKLQELKALTYYQDITGSPNPQAPNLYVDAMVAQGDYEDSVSAAGTCNNGERCNFRRHWSIQDIGNQQSRQANKIINVFVSWSDPDQPGGTSQVTLPPSVMPIKFR